MSSCKIAIHPQLIGADPVVPANGAGAIIVFLDRLWLGDLNYCLVRWRTIRLVQLAEALMEDAPPLSNSTHRCHKKLSIPIDPTDGDEFRLASLLANRREDRL